MSELVDGEYPAFEVFVQKEPLGFHVNVGSLRAPNPDMALQLARETFFRREEAYDIWVVPQECIFSAPHDEAYLPVSGLDKRYRLPSGYDNASRWKRFKSRALTLQDVVDDVLSPQKR